MNFQSILPHEKLFMWIHQNGYMPDDNACEAVISSTEQGDYAAMKSQISVPVEKIAKTKK